ncbi:hypothetical protein NDU88_006256 [Pleurodeles waltl]|uniref:Uncharacterized protein n=1 Tax=Pleurodeles waltl TaxID=8319 RepID=A0AAV7NRE3_PLEWA|nr:hypothetical protein NDU88_006256 [Pleurodeles waltl]
MRKGGPGGTMSGCWTFQSARRGLPWNPLLRTGSEMCCSQLGYLESLWWSVCKGPGAPLRAIIARLLNYKDRVCVLRAACESDKELDENCKISIYPDYTNKVQNSRKGFMEVKAKLRAMNISYMLLYPACLKVLLGGRSHFFDRAEEVWRWLEMWDKVATGRTEGTGGVTRRASGVESPDWRSHETGRLADSCHRVEIQRDGTMAVVTAESVGGTALEQELEVGGDSGIT